MFSGLSMDDVPSSNAMSTPFPSMDETDNVDLSGVTHSTVGIAVMPSQLPPASGGPMGEGSGAIIGAVLAVVVVIVGSVVVAAIVIAWRLNKRKVKSSYTFGSIFARKNSEIPPGKLHVFAILCSYHNICSLRLVWYLHCACRKKVPCCL